MSSEIQSSAAGANGEDNRPKPLLVAGVVVFTLSTALLLILLCLSLMSDAPKDRPTGKGPVGGGGGSDVEAGKGNGSSPLNPHHPGKHPYPTEKFVECWHYRHSGSKHRGANSWPTLPCIRNNHCGGKRQSPINIDLASVAKGAAIPPLTFTNFDVPIAGFQLVNNGHSVALKPAAHDNTKRTVTGGMLRSTYVFTQLHFHWGSKDGQGSEHLINNKPFEMEMHQVYMNEKYDNATEAVKHPDGFAVLATLYEIGTNTRDLDVLVSNYQFVHKAGQVHAMDPQGRQNQVVLTELLPENVSEFFTYEGSLTTPPCWETVTWTVFHAPSAVKADQLTEYRKLVDIEDVHIANNYRPPQALNGRTVKATFQP